VIPYLGRYLNRRPTYTLSRRPAEVEETESASDAESGAEKERPKVQKRPTVPRTHTGATLETITSRVNDRYYAVLPHGVTLPGWTEEEKLELNDHVRHMLHSRRSKFKRAMKGFGQYVKRRECPFPNIQEKLTNIMASPRIICNCLRNPHHPLRPNLGPFPNRYVYPSCL